jgi:hypothetical protein
MAITIRSFKTVTLVCVLLLVAGAASMRAGGALEQIDITANAPSPIPGHILASVVGIKWDVRSIPVQYSMNTTLDPVPNPLGAPVLTLAQAQAEFQASFDAWNDIPTSFIDMRITGTTGNPGLVGFDFINELTFRTSAGFAAIASSPSVSLMRDTTFVDGMLIDNDADPDVAAGITVATDVDSDGDLEFPEGLYKAGTILDNDVQYNTKTSNGLRFTVDPTAVDNVTRSVDLGTVAVHEFGHSHGLSHSLNNQNSSSDGNGATMYPFIDTGDPASEIAQESLDIDDIAYSSHFYREGTAATGPAALQPGDVAFSRHFGVITGNLHHGGLNQPVAGGHVFTINEATRTASSGAFSGTTRLSFNPANGGLFFLPSPADGVADGTYEIPVPRGRYSVHVEPVDGSPVPAGSVSFTAQIGSFYGQQNFNEERGVRVDGKVENHQIVPGLTAEHVDLVTSTDVNIDNFGALNAIGFTNATGNFVYAVRVPAAQIAAIAAGRKLIVKAVAFDTHVVDASVPPIFAEAVLTTGTVNADGTLTPNMLTPLARAELFLGQDGDLAPFALQRGLQIGRQIQLGIQQGVIENVVMLLRPTAPPYAGVSGISPLIGLSGPITGFSYLSTDGGATFNPFTTRNFRFSLRFADTPIEPDTEP